MGRYHYRPDQKRQENARNQNRAEIQQQKVVARLVPYLSAMCLNCKHFDRIRLAPTLWQGFCTRGATRYGRSQTFRPRECIRVVQNGWCSAWESKQSVTEGPDPVLKAPMKGIDK